MMRVLVTGSSGTVGSQIVSDLSAADHMVVVDYDLAKGQDILDPAALLDSARGCDVVVHSAALLGLSDQNDSEIMAANLQGTWNVLSAAQEAGIPRVVFLSSVDALGVFKGERSPDYLPLDDTHPCYPTTPYAISKYLAEDMCRLFSASTDVSQSSVFDRPECGLRRRTPGFNPNVRSVPSSSGIRFGSTVHSSMFAICPRPVSAH